MVLASVVGLAGSLTGAFLGGDLGYVRGLAVAVWIGALLWWWEFYAGMRESDMVPIGDRHAEQGAEQGIVKPVSALQASSVQSVSSVSHDPSSGHAPVPISSNGSASHGLPATPRPFSAQATWTAVVDTDPTYYRRMWMAWSLYRLPPVFPEYSNERTFVLAGKQMRIGRRSTAHGPEPEIGVTGPPTDPAVSRLHAVLIPAPDGTWAVLDPGSANGTLLNGRKLATGTPIPLRDGDRINLGAWTVITVRRGS